MDSFAAAGDRGSNADPQSAGPKEAVMWWLIIGVVALCTAISVVISRRGSTGASRADDLPSPYRSGSDHGSAMGGIGGFDGGIGGGD